MTNDEVRKCIAYLEQRHDRSKVVADNNDDVLQPLNRYLRACAHDATRFLTGIEPEDVAQATFAIIVDPSKSALPRLRQVAHPLAYIRGMVNNVARKMLRKQSAEPLPEDHEAKVQSTTESPEHRLERREVQTRLREVFETLGSADLEILAETVRGRGITSIADGLGLTYAAVAKRRSRIIQLLGNDLRRLLSPELVSDKALASYVLDIIGRHSQENKKTNVKSD